MTAPFSDWEQSKVDAVQPAPAGETADERLAEITARVEGATAGPWKTWGMSVMADPVGNSNLDDALPIASTADTRFRKPRTFNADFIAHARQDVPALVAALRAVLDLHPRGEFWASGGMVWFGRTEFPDQCTRCRDNWPCADVRAIESALGGAR